jgi:hypothetical protein
MNNDDYKELAMSDACKQALQTMPPPHVLELLNELNLRSSPAIRAARSEDRNASVNLFRLCPL